MSTNPLKSRQVERQPPQSPEEVCDHHNQILAGIIPTSKGDFIKRNDIRWYVRDGKPVLDWVERPHIAAHPFKHPMDRRGEPMSAQDTAILNRCLEEAGAKVRYYPNGTRYTVADAA